MRSELFGKKQAPSTSIQPDTSPELRHDEQGFGTLIEIPAGPFLMGSDKSRDPKARNEELPQHEVSLPRYWMNKTPVTVAQFRAYVQASGIAWKYFAHQGEEDYPIQDVTWYEALAYCEWLTGLWRASGHIDAKEVALLPSEAEWEKAARGMDGNIYPWGDEPDARRCNVDSSVGDKTPVGANSPQGDSPYGCVDMAGNIY